MAIIGCVKEIKPQENRVGLTPAGVKKLVKKKHTVYIEAGAGDHAGFTDADYRSAGATLVRCKEVWKRSDIVVKVKEPIKKEYGYLKYLKNKILFTYLHLAAVDPKLTKCLLKYHVNAIAYETVEGDKGGLPLLKPMSEIAGVLATQYGAEYLQLKHGGRGLTLSKITGADTAQVVVLGSGTVGGHAIMTAAGLGAQVTVVQRSMNKVPSLKKHFAKVVGTTLVKNISFVTSTPANIAKVVKSADLLVGAVLVPGARAPVLVSQDMVKSMKKGAVIVDVAVDQGGCIWGTKPTTHNKPIYHLYGKVYNAVANMPGQVAFQSTQALTHATLPYLVTLADKGMKGVSKGFARGINVSGGKLRYKAVAEALKMMKWYEEL